MAAAYCHEAVPLRFLASLFDIRYEISMVGTETSEVPTRVALAIGGNQNDTT